MSSVAWTAVPVLPDQVFSKKGPFKMSIYRFDGRISNKKDLVSRCVGQGHRRQEKNTKNFDSGATKAAKSRVKKISLCDRSAELRSKPLRSCCDNQFFDALHLPALL